MDGAAALQARTAPTASVGIGGGAALDVAKVVGADRRRTAATCSNTRGTIRRCGRSTRPLPYFVALPTTSGTGSEVGRSRVISEDATHVKRIVFSPAILAQGGVRRSRTHARPAARAVTAATGMDALTHNIE